MLPERLPALHMFTDGSGFVMDGFSDKIKLEMPLKADYVSVARLAVSGVASRMGFDIDSVEDIKVAVSEVCNMLLQTERIKADSYCLVFEISGSDLKITFMCSDGDLGCIFNKGEEELGVSIINALMDDVELCTNGGHIISMRKAVEGNTRDERE